MTLIEFASKPDQLTHNRRIFALCLRFLILNPFFFLHFVIKLASNFVIFANYFSKFLLSINDDPPSDLLVQCVSLRGQIIQKNLFVGEDWHVFGGFKGSNCLCFSFWRTVTNFGGAVFVFARHRQVIKNELS